MLTLTLFGATGDLARRYLFPALDRLSLQGKLPEDIRIQAIGRRPYDTAEFLRQLPDLPNLRDAIEYVKLDISQPEGYELLVKRPGVQVFFLAIEPHMLPSVVKYLGDLPRTDGQERRVALEKPFGSDLRSAQELDRLLHDSFQEPELFRLDHYLGKETVQNLLALRFANPMLEPVWNAECIDHIQVTVAEAEGIGTRGGFYDATGAVRDFLQNHIMQIVSLLLMRRPGAIEHDALSDRVREVVASLSAEATVFGQYEGYRAEDKVDPDSRTETFVAAKFVSGLPEWQGVPVYVRTGKALQRRFTEVVIEFKPNPDPLFGGGQPDRIILRLQPNEGISVRLAAKEIDSLDRLQPVEARFCYADLGRRIPDAYERMFAAIFQNDRTFALRSDVIEASWRLIDGILASHSAQAPLEYQRGSWGPAAADELLARDGQAWQMLPADFCQSDK